MKSIFELAATTGDTTAGDTRGDSRSTNYMLEPVMWLREIVDAAKKDHIFTQFADQRLVTSGNKSIIFPYRTAMIPEGQYPTSAGAGAAVTFTRLNNLNGVEIVPADANAGIALPNRTMRTHALDLVRQAKDELIYHAGEMVDVYTATSLGDATAAVTAARGAQTIYGGDARADSELATGDTIVVDHVADAKTKLQSTICKYWNPSSPAAEAVSSQSKNPWKSTPREPFVLAIAPEQENVFLKSSQFVNAAEYGDRAVIMNGEIGSVGGYLGTKIVVSNNVESFTAAGTGTDASTAAATGHRCMYFKAKKSMGFAWGLKPALKVFDFPTELETRLVLELAYAAGVIHDDAVCFIDVADA